MGLESEHEILREDHEQLCLQFISTELDLAITFCQIAISAENSQKAERNLNNAKRAYAAATQRLEELTMGPRSTSEIDDKLRRLQGLFSDLDRIQRPRM
jgi:hypothetical protein